MGAPDVQRTSGAVWRLVSEQHGVVAHRQLLALGFGAKAIKHRVAAGRLHPVRRGVYAVGRPEVSERGRWMAAVLACGSTAVLSHASAAALWGIRIVWLPRIDVSVPPGVRPRAEGVILHRRANLETTTRHNIPVTTITATLIDLASFLTKTRSKQRSTKPTSSI